MSGPAASPGSPVDRFLAAARDGQMRKARQILERHPDLPRRSFMVACSIGDVSRVEEALRRDPSLATSREDPLGWPPLLYLCASRFHRVSRAHARGCRRCAELLLDHGADPNTFMLFDPHDENSRIPALYFACVGDQTDVVRLLLERGANPNDGESVYHAAELNHRECLGLLLAHGADLSEPHAHWGNTPLYFLAGFFDHSPEMATVRRGMSWLLEHGADPNVFCGAETPLHRLLAGGAGIEAVGLLLDHGADAGLPRKDGRTPYALAIRAGRSDVAELLASRGATSEGMTPADRLIGACMRADEAAARSILSEHPRVIATFTEEDRGAIARAAHDRRHDSVRLMASLGFDLASEGPWAGTALHWAAWLGDPAMVRALIDLGAPVNVRDREHGSSPMGWAAHGSANCRTADDDYLAVIEALGSARTLPEAAINRSNQDPASLARPRVARRLRELGFAEPESIA